MTSKYELTLSTDYVKSWSYIEAIRELFQNAIDNEITNPENKMEFAFKDNKITISNKTSILEVNSLLLGHSTKQGDKNTIGQHGEGYKIAFMVLLREGKGIKVYNYGKKEVWEARLVKSKRFNGALIPTIFVQKAAIWDKIPNHNLIIEVTGISEEEFQEIKKKNLHLQSDVAVIELEDGSRILTDTENERGNIYVKGLFICNNSSINYGYDFRPSLIDLDRDRRLVNDFNVYWNSSMLWRMAAESEENRSALAKLIDENASDIRYITDMTTRENGMEEISSMIADNFISEHGPKSVPVTTNGEMEYAKKIGLKPVIVAESIAKVIKRYQPGIVKEIEIVPLSERFEAFRDKIESKLTDDELNELNSLIDEL